MLNEKKRKISKELSKDIKKIIKDCMSKNILFYDDIFDRAKTILLKNEDYSHLLSNNLRESFDTVWEKKLGLAPELKIVNEFNHPAIFKGSNCFGFAVREKKKFGSMTMLEHIKNSSKTSREIAMILSKECKKELIPISESAARESRSAIAFRFNDDDVHFCVKMNGRWYHKFSNSTVMPVPGEIVFSGIGWDTKILSYKNMGVSLIEGHKYKSDLYFFKLIK